MTKKPRSVPGPKNLEEAARLFDTLRDKAEKNRNRGELSRVKVSSRHEKALGIGAYAVARLYLEGIEKVGEHESTGKVCKGMVSEGYLRSASQLIEDYFFLGDRNLEMRNLDNLARACRSVISLQLNGVKYLDLLD